MRSWLHFAILKTTQMENFWLIEPSCWLVWSPFGQEPWQDCCVDWLNPVVDWSGLLLVRSPGRTTVLCWSIEPCCWLVGLLLVRSPGRTTVLIYWTLLLTGLVSYWSGALAGLLCWSIEPCCWLVWSPIGQEPWQDYCVEPPCGQLNPVNPNVSVVLGQLYREGTVD